MKKLVLAGVVGFLVILLLGVAAIFFFLNGIVERGVEAGGSHVSKVAVRLDGASLSPFSGTGHLKGLFIGNPEGYKSEFAVKASDVTISLEPSSLMSDPLVVREIKVMQPQVTLEGGLQANNLTKILENVQQSSGTSSGTQGPAAEKRFRIGEFLVQGGKVHLNLTMLGAQPVTVELPEIHLKDLGQSGAGITASELTKEITDALLASVMKAASQSLGDVDKLKKDLSEVVGKEAAKQVEKATKGLNDLFKKRP